MTSMVQALGLRTPINGLAICFLGFCVVPCHESTLHFPSCLLHRSLPCLFTRSYQIRSCCLLPSMSWLVLVVLTVLFHKYAGLCLFTLCGPCVSTSFACDFAPSPFSSTEISEPSFAITLYSHLKSGPSSRPRNRTALQINQKYISN